jgi:hypothetical protein
MTIPSLRVQWQSSDQHPIPFLASMPTFGACEILRVSVMVSATPLVAMWPSQV